MYDLEDVKDRLKDLHRTLDKLDSKLDSLVENTIKNTISLEQHIARTELNESRIEKLEYWLLGLLGSLLVAVIAKFIIWK